MPMPERFINSKVLKYITWPQYKYGCSLASLTCVVNYLYAGQIGVQMPEEVARMLGKEAEDIGWDGGPSDKTLIQWFDQFVKRKRIGGSANIGFARRDVADLSHNRSVCNKFNSVAHDENKVMAKSGANHYLLVAGYFDAAVEPESAYTDDSVRWIVLADHWPGGALSRVPAPLKHCAREAIRALSECGLDLSLCLTNTPVRCKRWRDVRQDVLRRGHKILVFSK